MGNIVNSITLERYVPKSIQISPDGNYFLFKPDGKDAVRLYNFKTYAEVFSIKSEGVNAAFNSNSEILIEKLSEVECLSIDKLQVVSNYKLREQFYDNIFLSNDHSKILAEKKDSIEIYETNSLKFLGSMHNKDDKQKKWIQPDFSNLFLYEIGAFTDISIYNLNTLKIVYEEQLQDINKNSKFFLYQGYLFYVDKTKTIQNINIHNKEFSIKIPEKIVGNYDFIYFHIDSLYFIDEKGQLVIYNMKNNTEHKFTNDRDEETVAIYINKPANILFWVVQNEKVDYSKLNFTRM